MSNFDHYLANVPKIHTWDGGKTWTTGGFTAQQLDEMHHCLAGLGLDLKIIETGAGNSTLMFLHLPVQEVVSIAPDEALFERIETHGQRFELDLTVLRLVNDCSEWALPQMAMANEEPRYDACLIDGEHNFPNVFLDFFYLNYMMKTGGIMLVDDVQIHSCNELSEFLAHEQDFELVLDVGKLRGYRRTSERRVLRGWKSGYNMKKQAERSGAGT